MAKRISRSTETAMCTQRSAENVCTSNVRLLFKPKCTSRCVLAKPKFSTCNRTNLYVYCINYVLIRNESKCKAVVIDTTMCATRTVDKEYENRAQRTQLREHNWEHNASSNTHELVVRLNQATASGSHLHIHICLCLPLSRAQKSIEYKVHGLAIAYCFLLNFAYCWKYATDRLPTTTIYIHLINWPFSSSIAFSTNLKKKISMFARVWFARTGYEFYYNKLFCFAFIRCIDYINRIMKFI